MQDILLEPKFNNLCAHYKDTFGIHRATVRHRDKLFYSLLIIIATFTFQLTFPQTINHTIDQYLIKSMGIGLGKNTEFISTVLWLLLLGFSTRYFQLVVEIERQYDYIHELENELNKYYPNSVAYAREGKGYLNNYPIFSNWVWALYTICFPILLLFSIYSRIASEINSVTRISVNNIINFTSYLIVGTSTVLYLFKLHGNSIINLAKHYTGHLLQWFRLKGTRPTRPDIP